MRRHISLIFLWGCLLIAGAVEGSESSCLVRYISAENVYLDAGSNDGLGVGTRVQLVRDGKVFAELEVVYAAGHSASCKVVHQDADILAGDAGVFEGEAAVRMETVPAVVDSLPRVRTRDTWSEALHSPAMSQWQVRGSVALQWDHSTDGGDRKLDTDLLSLPFRVRVNHEDHSWHFRARGNLRQIRRDGFSAATPESEWRNRMREVAILRDDKDLDWNFALGRINTRATASAGSFDGVHVSRRLKEDLRLGAFAGFAPRWEDYGFSTEDRLMGLSLNLQRYWAAGNRLDVVLSGVGRYHLSEVSREYLVLTSTWSSPSGLSLVQSGELDFNRKWRKEAAGVSAVSLSSLALNGRYRINRRFTFNLGFDDRQPIRTWETKSLPDSLFKDAGRRGWRAGVAGNFSGGRQVKLQASLRTDERTGQDTKSWNGRVYWPNFPAQGFRSDVSVRGFSGPWLSGLAPMLGVTRTTPSGWHFRIEGGHYAYTGQLEQEDRSSSWAKLQAGKDLGGHWSLAADLRQDWGSDTGGQRWFLEMRHRF